MADLSENFNNWEAIASDYGVNLSVIKVKIDPLFESIKQDDVFTDLLSKIEKIQVDLNNVFHILPYVNKKL